MNQAQSHTARFRTPPPMGRRNTPPAWRSALVVASAYAVVAFVYIQVSGHLALAITDDAKHLARIEALKGTVFVLVTSLCLLAICYAALRRFQVSESVLRDREERLLTAQSRAVSGDVAAACAHDLANILAVSQSHLELASQGERGKSGDHDHLTAALAAQERAISLLRSLGTSTATSAGPKVDHLAQVIACTRAMAGAHRSLQGCAISDDIDERAGQSLVDGMAVQRFLLNALINAGEANPRGAIMIEARCEDEHWVTLAIHDAGPGIPCELGQRILEPYVSTKERGSGLGMVAAVACARIHHGELELGRSSSLGGARVAVRLHSQACATATKPNSDCPVSATASV